MFLFAQGTSGDQSSRYFRSGQNFDEAKRAGYTLGESIYDILQGTKYTDKADIKVKNTVLSNYFKEIPSIEEAAENLDSVKSRYEKMKRENASYPDLRSVECNIFGAERTLDYAKLVKEGKPLPRIDKEHPLELSFVKINDSAIIFTQGEMFVAPGLEIKNKSKFKNTFVITLTNGGSAGYIYTKEALDDFGGYEVETSQYSPEMSDHIVEQALALMAEGRLKVEIVEYEVLRGMKISRMTLGTVQLGMEYGISNSTGKPDRKESFSILDKAMEGGINSFDTALAYGDSEAVLGNYFNQEALKNKDYTITTKFAFKEKKPFSKREIEAQVNEFVNKSLSQLKQDKLQIVMLHHYDDLEFYGKDLVNAMKKVKSNGLTDKIGVSVHNPYTIKNVIGYGAFDAIQAPMNILDTRIPESGVLEELKKEEMIVFIRSVFLQGLIFKDENSAMPPNIECARPYLSKLRDIARRENIGIAELAMAYVRDLPGVTSLVVGCETKSQVEQNVACINTPSLSQETVREIQEAFAGVPETVINPMKWAIG